MEPSDKKGRPFLLALGGVIILTFLAGIVPAKWFGIAAPYNPYGKIDLTSIEEDVAEDRNGDGVIDWEEIVTQTYSGDKEEAKTTPTDPQALAMLNDPNNVTGVLAKNFYLASAYIEKTGEGNAEAIAQQLLEEQVARTTHPTYTKADINVQPSETEESVRVYGNEMGKIVKQILDTQLAQSDHFEIQLYVEKKDQKSLESLKNKKELARTIIAKLRSMKVPPSAFVFHVTALNRMAAYEAMIGDVVQIETDPVRASMAFSTYVDVVTELMNTAHLYVTYFQTKNITFSPQEAGFVFDERYTIGN